ncbi:MAG: metalloregulator ArsR/SmtB family transcription factor [Candidatus Jordarchaeales archaeon]
MAKEYTIEEVLSSRGRVRVLRILAEAEELNISEIARRAGLNHKATSNHLKVLRNAGLVQEKRFGRVRIFRIKSENAKAAAFKQLVDSWKT